MNIHFSDIHQRTILLTGKEGLEKLKNSHVAIFGLGGVGGYALEAIARAGVGTITIVDYDSVESSNINRQVLATIHTLKKLKTDLAEERILSVNPEAKIYKHSVYISEENLHLLTEPPPQYAIDAIDTVKSKVVLLEHLYNKGITVVSCMGAGLRLNPLKIRCEDISKTHTCPLAKAVRSELKKKGIHKGIICIFSEEPPKQKVLKSDEFVTNFNKGIGSISYLPGIIGLTAGGIIIQKILKE
ncbi:MAG: tRNA threonylcarbamoyladenosine dehydratase [Candidatus Hydrogenedentes bacterium]|nr:tRNA threonylcarbamoyladenosine dehydratase [Candidatus Hydrogenedentota bacterium]